MQSQSSTPMNKKNHYHVGYFKHASRDARFKLAYPSIIVEFLSV